MPSRRGQSRWEESRRGQPAGRGTVCPLGGLTAGNASGV